eukprot:CAMPEP_0170126854 /NCGR_PEP_ID=MMETSP0020_2-20130122/20042_1 /TAXON_ID=98059 /ORGANISM="Dinobryon sp., Strain UTEXLB2267" /LENGTH=920 /DNA_ID=CAMNT_0010360101 /DNA_START=2004 /DNA_END=4763 /DNA_ORIENTATION=+
MEKGSFDNGDPNTTNIYIGNLAPTITEEQLLELFGRYGDINSVKVMWPRSEEEKARKRNCGFVSFKRRRDAEDAKLELQDYDVEGYKMILGWGRAVKINAAPFTLPASGRPLPLPPGMPAMPSAPLQTQPSAPVSSTSVSLQPPPPGTFLPPPPTHLPQAATSAFTQLQPPSLQQPFLPPTHAMEPPSEGTSPQVGGFQPKPPPPMPPSFYNPPTSTPNTFTTSSTTARTPAEVAAAIAASISKSMAINNPSTTVAESAPPPTRPESRFSSAFPNPNPPPPQSTNTTTAYTPSPSTGISNSGSLVGESSAQDPIAPSLGEWEGPQEGDPCVQVLLPADPQRRAFIDLLAGYVAADGEAFEKAVKIKEEGNPEYQFLFNCDSPEAIYYRWRSYVNILGESTRRWRDRPFKLMKNGLFFIPPLVPPPHLYPQQSERDRSRSPSPSQSPPSKASVHSGGKDRESIRESTGSYRGESDRRRKRSRSYSPDRDGFADRGGSRASHSYHSQKDSKHLDAAANAKGMTGAQMERARARERSQRLSRLSKEDHREWSRMLSTVSLRREAIKQAMGFAFDKIESAEEIVGMIRERLFVRSHAAAVKIIGLFLLSDILHNSGAPIKHASNYRTLIQSLLPEAIENLSTLFRATLGRMSAFQIEDRVKKLFSFWSSSSVFPPLYLAGLEAAFYMTESEFLQLQLTISQQQQQQRAEQDEDQLEALRRRAKAAGVYVGPNSTVAELTCKLEYCERYLKRTLTGGGADPFTTLLKGLSKGQHQSVLSRAAAEEEDDENEEDIDGVPIDDIDGVPLDDIDGMPLDNNSWKAVSNMKSSGFHAVEDIDGVPIDPDEDIDGVPMMDEQENVPNNATEVIANNDSDEDSLSKGASAERKRLRAQEALLLRLRDQLEARGCDESEIAAVLKRERDKGL